jgi:predicted AlkP superfamily phosphohydrolase/phosphomutase
MVDVVSRRFPETPGAAVSDGVGARLAWQGKPADFDALCERVALIQTAMYRAVSEARRVDQQVDWKLLTVRFESLGRLLHSSWDFLGLPDQVGGNRQWVGKTREAFRTLDRCLGELLSLAEDRGAAVALVGPYGTTAFRERINVNSLLLRNDLLAWSGRLGTTAHRLSRRFWKLRRRVRFHDDDGRPLEVVLPVQWKKTRAFTVHGRFAAMVYFNTAARFEEGVLRTAEAEEETAARTVAVFKEATHPVTKEPLFREVIEARQLCGQEPRERFWPDVIAVPAVGFHAHHRPERHSLLVRPTGQTASTHCDEGLFAIKLPGVSLGEPREANLTDVAPTILAALGLPAEPTVTGAPITVR